MLDDEGSIDQASLSPEYSQPLSSLEDDFGPPSSPHHELSLWNTPPSLSMQGSTEKLASLESDSYESAPTSLEPVSPLPVFADEDKPVLQDPSHIDFTNTPYIDIHAIVARLMIPGNPVTKLSLQLCHLNDPEIKTLATAFDSEHCQVEICNLANNRITTKGFNHLIKRFSLPHQRLNYLNISGNPIKDRGAYHLSELIKNNDNHITHIDVCYCEIGEDGIAMIAESLNHIHRNDRQITLNIGGNLCGSEKAVTSIANLLRESRCCLVELNLMKSQLTNTSMHILIPALYANTSLQRLDLFGHDFNSDTLKRLELALQYSASLTWLRLSEKQLNPIMTSMLIRNQTNQRQRELTLFSELSALLLPISVARETDDTSYLHATKRQRR